MSPDAIVLLASNAPMNKTLPPEPTTSKEPLAAVVTNTCVIVSVVPVESGKSIAFVFFIVCVSADSVVNVQFAASTCCLA